MKTFANPGGSLILSKGRADIGFYWNILWTVALFVMISIALYFKLSIESVALAQLISGILFGPAWHYLVVKYGAVNYRKLLLELSKLMFFFFPAYILVYLVNLIGFENILISFFLKLIGGGILYVLYFLLVFKKQIPIIQKIIK